MDYRQIERTQYRDWQEENGQTFHYAQVTDKRDGTCIHKMKTCSSDSECESCEVGGMEFKTFYFPPLL